MKLSNLEQILKDEGYHLTEPELSRVSKRIINSFLEKDMCSIERPCVACFSGSGECEDK